MATITSSFSSLSSLNSAASQVVGTLGINATHDRAQVAYNNALNTSPLNYVVATSTQATGVFGGDTFTARGSNLLSFPRVIDQLDYTFGSDNAQVRLNGSIVQPTFGGQVSGSITREQVSTPGFGTTTLTLNFQPSSFSPYTLSNVSYERGGATLSLSGSLLGPGFILNPFPTFVSTVTGDFTSGALSLGAESMSFSGLAIPGTTVFASGDQVLSAILSGNDGVNGTSTANFLVGLAGNDTVSAGDGDDTLDGGTGIDSLNGEGGNDVILGGDDNDVITGGSGNDLIVGEAGNDSVLGGAGNDSIDGRAGDDTLRGEEEVDILFGDAGADQVYGGTGSDVVMGERGGVSTSGGNDTLYGDLDANALDGGADTIDGDAGDDLIYGGGGGDIILGDNGNDTIEGGAGADIIGGSAASLASIETTGNDTFVYRALTDLGDSIFGFDIRVDDNDWIDLRPLLQSVGYTAGTARADGYVRVVASGADALVQVDLDGSTNGASFTTLLTLVERTAADITDTYFLYTDAVSGTADGGPNQLVGNASANTLSGLAGNDTLLGREGNDTLSGDDGNDSILGEAGDDVILGGADNDQIFGGAGNDLIVGEAGNDSVLGGTGNDSIDGRDGTDTINAQDGVDIVFGDLGADSILGGNGNDVLMGERGGASVTGGNDTIRGEDGDDLIDGDAGDDMIFGGNGNDVILGDNGFDVIEGGAGADIMGGSAASLAGPETTGNDIFVYSSMSDAGDSIYGFDVRAGNSDMFDLLSLFATLGYFGATPRADGYVQVQQSGADVLVQIDANGSTGGAAFTTLLTLIDRNAADITDDYFSLAI